MENCPFRELGGNLMWLSASTRRRPDILNAVGTVARYGCTPRAVHLKTALGILAYTKRPAFVVFCGVKLQLEAASEAGRYSYYWKGLDRSISLSRGDKNVIQYAA